MKFGESANRIKRRVNGAATTTTTTGGKFVYWEEVAFGVQAVGL